MSRRRGLATPFLVVVGVLAAAGTSTVGLASNATVYTAVVNVGNMQTTMLYGCDTGCTNPIAGTSSGHVAGTDDTGSPFEVLWPDPAITTPVNNMSGTMTVSAICSQTGNVLLGGTVNGASFSISGALMYYGSTRAMSSATVTGNFVGFWRGDTLVVTATTLSISGATSITVPSPFGEGVMQLTPIPPLTGCTTLSQPYSISGTVLYAG
jgi:hypothetical protein